VASLRIVRLGAGYSILTCLLVVVSVDPASQYSKHANFTPAAFVALFVFLRLNHQRNQTWKQRLARLDIARNAIFIATIIAVLIALTWGGTIYDWQTYHIVVPIVLGFVGIAAFVAFEWIVSKEPSFPRSIVSNRTSIAALIATLMHAICIYWAFYFMPIYFQAVRGASAMRSGRLQVCPRYTPYWPSPNRCRYITNLCRRPPIRDSRWDPPV
jgi:hypothetical protein